MFLVASTDAIVQSLRSESLAEVVEDLHRAILLAHLGLQYQHRVCGQLVLTRQALYYEVASPLSSLLFV